MKLFPVLSWSVVAAFLLVLANVASAQTDFLKRGQELLRQVPGTGSSSGGATTTAPLSDVEIGSGLREALKVGVQSVVGQVGAVDGYNGDPKIHIPLPDSLQTVQKTLSRVGASSVIDDLELRLNRAAEAAAPEAQEVFWKAIDEMTLDDVRQIYEGPNDAATRYFERTMSPPLVERMKPIVNSSLAEVGAIQAYDNAIGQYKAVPFVPDVKADLSQHVLERALQGLFLYLAEEEAAIRQNPVKQTTALLQRVFGG
ncbi:MAG: DUF4197 domain-containing protein [Alphaproteobacteria bacterium]|nr:DUF4197 domain-containing protein [Alphaproteobacteria bacterium]